MFEYCAYKLNAYVLSIFLILYNMHIKFGRLFNNLALLDMEKFKLKKKNVFITC